MFTFLILLLMITIVFWVISLVKKLMKKEPMMVGKLKLKPLFVGLAALGLFISSIIAAPHSDADTNQTPTSKKVNYSNENIENEPSKVIHRSEFTKDMKLIAICWNNNLLVGNSSMMAGCSDEHGGIKINCTISPIPQECQDIIDGKDTLESTPTTSNVDDDKQKEEDRKRVEEENKKREEERKRVKEGNKKKEDENKKRIEAENKAREEQNEKNKKAQSLRNCWNEYYKMIGGIKGYESIDMIVVEKEQKDNIKSKLATCESLGKFQGAHRHQKVILEDAQMYWKQYEDGDIGVYPLLSHMSFIRDYIKEL